MPKTHHQKNPKPLNTQEWRELMEDIKVNLGFNYIPHVDT